MCIMVIYDIKDSVKHHLGTRVCMCKHWKNEKMQVVIPELWHSCVLFLVGVKNVKFNKGKNFIHMFKFDTENIEKIYDQ